MREHTDASTYMSHFESKRSEAASENPSIKGVLKGGDVPPIRKKYMRIEDALIQQAWQDSSGSSLSVLEN